MVHTLCRSWFLNCVIKAPKLARQKSKRHPQWYQFRRPTEPHELAKEFFDDLYGKRFGKDWRSIRCAMLSRKKYAAIMNTFVDTDEVEKKLLSTGAVDIVEKLHCDATEQKENTLREIKNLSQNMKQSHVQSTRNNILSTIYTTEENCSDECENEEVAAVKLEWLENQCRLYTAITQTCHGLHVYLYPQHDMSEFTDPMAKGSVKNILDYFLLDGSSVLPILALDPKPHEHVLDICAAPGGKLMCILQILKNGNGSVVANDIQSSRVSRLRKVRDEYVPKDSTIFQNIKIISMDARRWEECETGVYDKVLVDVPCTTDRYSMLPTFEQRDNIFSQLRKRERASLPHLQMDILRNAILSCRPGGIVVYSTCTASAQQNEYVVQMVIQQMLQEYGISCEVEDLTALTDMLSDHFHFYKNIELGALVLPYVDANCGPTFVCKLSRTN